ncbi:hypothetical protein [Pseudomonas sp. LF-5]|jgi:filamentous hemagglutinin|uniref:hypothetical protein n=1 Tax=Pseudomonas sp. LF-5 TaxID=3031121 RepID=UPI0030B39CAF
MAEPSGWKRALMLPDCSTSTSDTKSIIVNKGISRDVVMNALERGQVVGTNGSANVYRITYNGVEQNIAVGVGSNGFVVRANPVSSWKPLP